MTLFFPDFFRESCVKSLKITQKLGLQTKLSAEKIVEFTQPFYVETNLKNNKKYKKKNEK